MRTLPDNRIILPSGWTETPPADMSVGNITANGSPVQTLIEGSESLF